MLGNVLQYVLNCLLDGRHHWTYPPALEGFPLRIWGHALEMSQLQCSDSPAPPLPKERLAPFLYQGQVWVQKGTGASLECGQQLEREIPRDGLQYFVHPHFPSSDFRHWKTPSSRGNQVQLFLQELSSMNPLFYLHQKTGEGNAT